MVILTKSSFYLLVNLVAFFIISNFIFWNYRDRALAFSWIIPLSSVILLNLSSRWFFSPVNTYITPKSYYLLFLLDRSESKLFATSINSLFINPLAIPFAYFEPVESFTLKVFASNFSFWFLTSLSWNYNSRILFICYSYLFLCYSSYICRD